MPDLPTGNSAAKPDASVAPAFAGIVLLLVASKLAIHLYADRYYGYFVDELYYLACSRHLDWGYVDQPPLIAAVAWLARVTLGQGLAAIRLLPALAGAGEVALTAIIVRELGGNRFAQALAALAVIVAPGILSVDNFLSMNAFEPLFWLGCAWLVIRIGKSGNQKLWIWFGILAGIGLENKYSMGIFGAGLVLAVLLTPLRRSLAGPWFWIAGAIAFLLFLPNLIWNVSHHFPFLELQANIRRSGRDVPLNPLAFFGEETLVMNPLTLPLWLAGLWFFFGSRMGRPFRALGWAWLFTATVIVIVSPRVYYLFPAYPILFAGGAVWWESLLGARPAWQKLAWPVLIAVSGILLAPLAIPALPPDSYGPYTQALHIGQPAVETHKLGPLPQLFADEFGWPEMAETVGRIYNNLPPEVRPQTAIFAQNYGQAGAIDLFGPRFGLPSAISGHQNYFLWGPRNYTGASMIVLDGRESTLQRQFTSVQKVAHFTHPYSMPYEHFDIYYCQGLKESLQDLWPQVKAWH